MHNLIPSDSVPFQRLENEFLQLSRVTSFHKLHCIAPHLSLILSKLLLRLIIYLSHQTLQGISPLWSLALQMLAIEHLLELFRKGALTVIVHHFVYVHVFHCHLTHINQRLTSHALTLPG